MPAFRFLHASDFHLERPPAGLAELPDHIRDVLVEAPYQAATNVFEAALAHEVDFVLLAGDIVAPKRSGPRAVLFLCEQFRRLAERHIDVYWAGGTADRVNQWPGEIRWPANVHVFGSDDPQVMSVSKQGKLLCAIVGQSLPADGEIDVPAFEKVLSSTDEPSFRIGLMYGSIDGSVAGGAMLVSGECPPAESGAKGAELAAKGAGPRASGAESGRIDYWALGGEHEPTLPQEMRPVVHYPGSPQGRSPAEAGPHGCTVVEVSQDGEICTTPIITDVVRFASERLVIPALAPVPASESDRRTAAEVERVLRERMQSLAEANPAVTLVVDFILDNAALPHATCAHLPLPTIAGVLRGEFGYRTPPVWLSRIQLPPPPPPPQHLLEQDTLLGDVLRTARHLHEAGQPVDLDRYLPDGPRREAIYDFIAVDEPGLFRSAMGEAAALAASLLVPEEARR